jgi:hypothetical protein
LDSEHRLELVGVRQEQERELAQLMQDRQERTLARVRVRQEWGELQRQQGEPEASAGAGSMGQQHCSVPSKGAAGTRCAGNRRRLTEGAAVQAGVPWAPLGGGAGAPLQLGAVQRALPVKLEGTQHPTNVDEGDELELPCVMVESRASLSTVNVDSACEH